MRVEEHGLIRRLVRQLERTSGYAQRRRANRAVQCPGATRGVRRDLAQGDRAHPGQVRDLVHLEASQPGRRPGPRLHRRLGTGQPRRHGDGAGALRQGRAGGGRGTRHRGRSGADHRDPHRQGAEHRGHRRLGRLRSERHGRAPRRAHHPGPSRRAGRAPVPGARGRRRIQKRHGAGRRGVGPLRAACRPRVHRARVAVLHRLLRDPEDLLGSRHRERAPLPLLRLRRRVLRGDRRYRHRRDARRSSGRPPRRRALAEPGHRHGGRSRGGSCRGWDG